jgi:hypothetical protein
MRSRLPLKHRAMLAGAVVAMAIVSLVGCSMVSPDSSWSGNMGTLDGNVTTPRGMAAAGISVWLWTDLGQDGGIVEYQVSTDAWGHYEITDIALGATHSYEHEYTLYVNRTRGSAIPLTPTYSTCSTSVTVSSTGTTRDIVLRRAVPDEPDQNMEG